jgi:hypothetical protein
MSTKTILENPQPVPVPQYERPRFASIEKKEKCYSVYRRTLMSAVCRGQKKNWKIKKINGS